MLPILLLALVAAPVSAWTPGATSGNWTVIERNHFVRNGTGISGYAQWHQTVTDFNGYWLMLHNVTWQNYREWWQFDSANVFYITIKIEASNGTVYAVTKLQGRTDLFGLLNTFHVSVGASDNATAGSQVPLTTPSFMVYNIEMTGWNPEEFQLFVIPESNRTKLVWIWSVGGKNVAYTTYCNAILNGTAHVALVYEHDGDGFAEGRVTDSFTLPPLPMHEGFKAGVAGWLSELIGIDLAEVMATLLSIVAFFFAVVKMTIPLLGAIAFFWVVDTIFTAITTGQVRLIGDMFLRIYDFVRAIWQTIVSIAQLIWDFITFWS